jgi:hypothetical protein
MKSADDLYNGILKNKIKTLEFDMKLKKQEY